MEVPVAELNCENVNKMWPYLIAAIRKAQIVAIDLELSGLGQRDGHRRFFGERYKQLCDAVQTRTVFSVGITTFQLVKQKEPNTVMYRCKVFDMLALEQRPFTVEPEALTFLSSHGFDFNRWLTYGIKYTKSATTNSDDALFKSLWVEILASGVSIALHNGLNDLAFLHEHFYAPMPDHPDKFLANISDWFGDEAGPKCNLWDSRFLATENPKFASSYLEYVFRKAQRENHRRLEGNSQPHLEIYFSRYRKEQKEKIPLTISRTPISFSREFLMGKTADIKNEQLCVSYKDFGHCRNRGVCEKVHDVDLILDSEEKKSHHKREKEKRRREKKRQYEAGAQAEAEPNETDGADQQNGTTKNGHGKKKRALSLADDLGLNGKKPKMDAVEMENQPLNGFAPQPQCPIGDGEHTSIPAGKLASRGRHRAGMDSFMTGFATLFLNLDHAVSNCGALDTTLAGRIPLPCQQDPLVITKKETFTARARQTEGHVLNWARIKSRRSAFQEANGN